MTKNAYLVIFWYEHMAKQDKSAGKEGSDARREQRANRILDVAAGLILRWGYNKTTIDDVARQAGVAKGTIYLHWNTREDLFVALMQRERQALSDEVKQRVAADPGGSTLHGLLKHSALALMQRPLLKAVLLRDIDIIGKIVHSEHVTATYDERIAAFTAYLEVLREHGLVRTDLSLRDEVYTLCAIFMGFFLVAPLMPEQLTPSDETIAELLAEAIQRTLGAQPAATLPGQAAVDDAVQDYLQRSDVALAQMQATTNPRDVL